ncbi:MAG: hypothetical protein WKG00_14955 [Polyangiaceae bacterium]
MTTWHLHAPVVSSKEDLRRAPARPARIRVEATCVEDAYDAADRYCGGRGLQMVQRTWMPPGQAEQHVVEESPQERQAAYEDLFQVLR